jgi:hypothetical protein
MSTYTCIREIYESAADAADTIRTEMKNYPDNDIGTLICQEANTLVTWTADNWDVCRIMRNSDESYAAEDTLTLGDYDDVSDYFIYLARGIWHDLICQALNDKGE